MCLRDLGNRWQTKKPVIIIIGHTIENWSWILNWIRLVFNANTKQKEICQLLLLLVNFHLMLVTWSRYVPANSLSVSIKFLVNVPQFYPIISIGTPLIVIHGLFPYIPKLKWATASPFVNPKTPHKITHDQKTDSHTSKIKDTKRTKFLRGCCSNTFMGRWVDVGFKI